MMQQDTAEQGNGPAIPTCPTAYHIVRATDEGGRQGHKARWVPRTQRESRLSPDASPVLTGGKERVRVYMANVYGDVVEGRVAE